MIEFVLGVYFAGVLGGLVLWPLACWYAKTKLDKYHLIFVSFGWPFLLAAGLRAAWENIFGHKM